MKSISNRTNLSGFLLVVAAVINLLLYGNNTERGHKEELSSTIVLPNRQDYDTTIIITSSLIPSHPSTDVIDQTIESLRFLEGLPRGTPIIITVDGYYKEDRGPKAPRNKVLKKYTNNLHQKYHMDELGSHITILQENKNIRLIGSVRKAMEYVTTEFVYLIQHDMPFIAPVNHTALVKTFQSDPDIVRLVRFSPRKTLARNRDRIPGVCHPDEIEYHSDTIHLSKTHTWSDNNHFTTRNYYEEMFSTIHGWDDVRYMEGVMKELGLKNCSYWGTYLYGGIGDCPMIVHLNGRKYGTTPTTAS